ncbi:MAG: methylmalonyl-CoA epimerase [Candidatus Latescibacterota bacterium]|jgi:methylmalonyl-CoA/ethylmalonyl-CoA epimerase
MLKVEHIGIAVHSNSDLAKTLKRLFGAEPYKSETVEREGVETIFFDGGGTKLESLEANNEESAIARFLDKRGEGLHHIAVEVDDIHAEFKRVGEEGFRILSEQPFRGADNKLVFFVHPKDCHGILIEFCQQIDA